MSDWLVTRFFATPDDIRPVLEDVESQVELRYVLAGLFESPDLKIFDSALEIPDLGRATAGDHTLIPVYVVAPRLRVVASRAVPQRKGGVRYVVEVSAGMVDFRPGGVFEQGAVIDGQVGARKADAEALRIKKMFDRAIARRFRKAKGWYLGPEAERLHEQGWRLTFSWKSPSDYDLRL